MQSSSRRHDLPNWLAPYCPRYEHARCILRSGTDPDVPDWLDSCDWRLPSSKVCCRVSVGLENGGSDYQHQRPRVRARINCDMS